MHYALQVLSQSLAQFRNLCTQSWCGCFPNIQEFYLEVFLNSLLCLEVFLSHFILWNIIYPLIYSTSFYYQPPTSLQIQTLFVREYWQSHILYISLKWHSPLKPLLLLACVTFRDISQNPKSELSLFFPFAISVTAQALLFPSYSLWKSSLIPCLSVISWQNSERSKTMIRLWAK